MLAGIGSNHIPILQLNRFVAIHAKGSLVVCFHHDTHFGAFMQHYRSINR